jgi:hypothetical protein
MIAGKVPSFARPVAASLLSLAGVEFSVFDRFAFPWTVRTCRGLRYGLHVAAGSAVVPSAQWELEPGSRSGGKSDLPESAVRFVVLSSTINVQAHAYRQNAGLSAARRLGRSGPHAARQSGTSGAAGLNNL